MLQITAEIAEEVAYNSSVLAVDINGNGVPTKESNPPFTAYNNRLWKGMHEAMKFWINMDDTIF